MMRIIISSWIPLLIMSGCAGIPAMSPDELKLVDVGDLCVSYGEIKGRKTRNELERRQALSPHEWHLVDQKKISVGISSCALAASWGPPARINTTVTGYGGSHQWVYRDCSTCKASYVYVDSGKVVAWQN